MTLPSSEEPLPAYEPTSSNINPPGLPEFDYTPFLTRIPKPTVSSRFKHSLRRNPGFCPGAFRYRRAVFRSPSNYPTSLMPQRRSLGLCQYYGLEMHKCYPGSYMEAWPGYARLNMEFMFESHVPATRLDHSDRKSCLLCWEDKRIWVEPMKAEAWGVHMRKHFKEDGYQVCKKPGTQLMQSRNACPAKKCTKIHS